MIIWLLTSEFPPNYGGGISTYSYETACMLSEQGHKVTVITQDFNVKRLHHEEGKLYDSVRFNPSTYYTFSFLGYEANLSYAFAKAVEELIGIKEKPDIIESQEYMGIAYYLLQYKWLQYPIFKDLKILITLHAPSFLYLDYNKVPHFQLPYFWIGEMERFCIRAADMLISPSAYLVKALQNRMETADLEINVVKNPYKISGSIPTDGFTKNELVFFGKLTPQKGCLELIEYFKRLWAGGFSHNLTMIGGGAHMYHPEGKDMIEFIREKYKNEIAAGKIKLPGSLPPHKVMDLLRSAHVVLVPSTVDNLPYAVLETMGQGKIILASIQGGQSEIIEDEKDGFLFDHSDPSSFSSKLQHIISLTDEEIKVIGNKANCKIRSDYSYEKIYFQKKQLLDKLLEKNTARTSFPLTRNFTYKEHTPVTVSEKDPLLSVVIPFYNMGEFVEETLMSIHASTYKNTEIIIVDDGSNKTESAILHKLKDSYNFKIISKENGGLASARNEGVKYAKGQLLAFLDPDDTIEPEYYQKAISVLKQHENIYFVGCWAKYFGGASGFWPAFNPEPPYLLAHNMINSSALVYKKEAFLIAGLNDPAMIYGMEDYESVISMISHGYHGAVLPEPLWNYRVRKNSMARNFTKKKQVYLYRLIAEKHSGFFSMFSTDLVNLLNANGPGFNYDNPTLFYNLPGDYLINGKLKNMIVSVVKSNPILRKIAIKIRRVL
jgi:glycosyltransferase involved in cell wall biosynthesis